MSEHQNPAIVAKPVDADGHLQMILGSILGFEDENQESFIGVSLVTAGGVITGTAHTRHTWAQGQIDMLMATGSEGAQSLGRVLKIVEDELSQKMAEEEERPVRGYINLKDAQVINGGSTVKYQWLRVDMREVIAWSLGVPDPSDNS